MAPADVTGTWRAIAGLGVWAVAVLPALALAAPAPDPGATVSELTVTASKTVEELTVTAPKKCLKPYMGDNWGMRGPKIVSTFPAKDAIIRPGVVVLRVTFDRPMACAGIFSDDPPFHNPCPGRMQHMLLSYDRLTVRTACVVEPNESYGAWISRNVLTTADDFISLTGTPSGQFELRFTTSAEPAITTVCEAIAEDEETAREIRKRRKLDCSAPDASGR
ncbi:MAG: hypothetical protein ACXU8S_17525 [Phenylobacterium sp.]